MSVSMTIRKVGLHCYIRSCEHAGSVGAAASGESLGLEIDLSGFG
jgi:hypothetical protein